MKHTILQVYSFGPCRNNFPGNLFPYIQHSSILQPFFKPVLLYQFSESLSQGDGLVPSHFLLLSVGDLLLDTLFPDTVKPEVNPGIVKNPVNPVLLGVSDKNLSELP